MEEYSEDTGQVVATGQKMHNSDQMNHEFSLSEAQFQVIAANID